MRCTATIALAALLSTSYAQPPTLQSCGGSVTWSSIVLSPTNPQAGDTVVLNGTGTAASAITNSGFSVGEIDAFLFGLEVYAAPIDTCGLGQQIDVLGLTTGVLDALQCPVAAQAPVKVGFSMLIPDEAQGLGQLQIIVNSTDQNKATAMCLNLTITL